MNWAELPQRLKLYISALTVFAVPVLSWAVWRVMTSPFENGWVVLGGLAVITVPFFLLLPSFNAAITVGDTYIMAIGMMYGVAPCIVTTFCYTLIISIVSQKPRIYFYRVVFNTASTVVVAWIYSLIYHATLRDSHSPADIIIPAAVLGTTFFLINSFLTSTAIAWSINTKVLAFWAKTCVPLAYEYSISTVCATVITALHGLHELIPLGAAPFIGIAWGWIRLNKIRAMEAEKHLREQEQLYVRTVESLALAVDAKDQTTYGHIRRVRVYATRLAKLSGIEDINELKAIETGALLHDIGKIAIDDYILNKPGRLSDLEFEKIKIHAAAGDEILQQVCFPFPVAKYVRYHHERWDGLGYPDGLKGDGIPIGARILSIADAFDAIRFSRPYKLSVETAEALEILKNQAGSVFDPTLVKLFTEHINELEEEAVRESENAPQLSFRKYFEALDQNAGPSTLPARIVPRDIPADVIRLSEFCASVLGYLDFPDVFPVIARRIGRLIPFSCCAIYVDGGRNHLTARYVEGLKAAEIQGHTILMGSGISGWAAAHRYAIMNTNPTLDFPNSGKLEPNLFSDALVVPVVQNNETLGTISLYSEERAFYSRRQLELLQTIAASIAPLISESKKGEILAPEDVLDPVTGLYRIAYLTAMAPQLIASAATERLPISFIYLDVRNLNQIVRTYGAASGNSSVKRIAECIKKELRETDILVRYGYQGFIAFLPGVREDQAGKCGQRLRQQIRTEFLSNMQGIPVDCRIGVSAYPKDGATILSLLQSALGDLQTASSEPASSDGNVVEFLHRA